MLTEAEKKWLEERAKRRPLKFCHYCPHNSRVYHACGDVWDSHGDCPVRSKIDFRDAAEFEARVAAWQADNLPSCDFCKWYEECFKTSCARTRLKHARLAVEAEMEQ